MSYLAGGGCGATACSAMLPTVLRVMLLRPETGIQILDTQSKYFVLQKDLTQGIFPPSVSALNSRHTGIQTHVRSQALYSKKMASQPDSSLSFGRLLYTVYVSIHSVKKSMSLPPKNPHWVCQNYVHLGTKITL